ncbi:hypothetical protein F5Y14DRAFT_449934 [Nemania sp. NC0429]|nr:hypothetical protein F5Y14DRAFT_449934 [Nemania sp. NC0429]
MSRRVKRVASKPEEEKPAKAPKPAAPTPDPYRPVKRDDGSWFFPAKPEGYQSPFETAKEKDSDVMTEYVAYKKRRNTLLLGSLPESKTKEEGDLPLHLFDRTPDQSINPRTLPVLLNKLSGSVITLSWGWAPKMLEWEKLDDSVREKLTGLAPKADRFLRGDTDLARLLLQSCIWNLLMEHVFSEGGSQRWAKHWESFAFLQNFCKACDSRQEDMWTIKYHYWRHFTATMLRHIDGTKPHLDLDHITNTIMDEMGPLFKSEENVDSLRNEIEKIADIAIILDVKMREQVEIWTCTMKDPNSGKPVGFPFEPPDMEGDPTVQPDAGMEDKGRPVDLVVSPLFVSCGGVEGGYYDIRDVKQRMVVVVDMFPDETGSSSGDRSGGDEG